MNDLGTIYVVMPAYNVEKFIGSAFESLLAQTYPYWKCLCMNDGSQDRTWDIIQTYARKDSRIVAFTHENQGVTKTRNALLEKVDGPYLAFMDSDDYLHPQTFEILLSFLKKNNTDAAECKIERFIDTPVQESLAPIDINRISSSILNKEDFLGSRSARGDLWINVVNKLYRWEVVKDIRFSEELSYEDDFFYSSQSHSVFQKKVCISQPLYFYRKNPTSLCNSVNWERYQKAGISRIRLSYEYFILGNRIPEKVKDAFMSDLSQDAYRMIIRKPLKKTKDRALFENAHQAIKSYVSKGIIDKKYLSCKQRLHMWLVLHGFYRLSRIMACLT